MKPLPSTSQSDVVRIRLTISYDGTAYAGWQVQKIGTGVQELIETALQRLFQQPLRLHSSSRTDTGVHALGMVAHVDLPRDRFRMPIRKLPLAINAHLPEDIRIVSASRCRGDFHARFQARGKEYRYFIWNHPVMNPLRRHQAWHVPKPLDLPAMRAAARRLKGKHDFRAFAANRNYEVEHTVRTLSRCRILREGPLITVVLRADGFLYKMCRSIAGTLVQVGLGRFTPEAVQSMLQEKNRESAGMSAPAHGLTLWKVWYGNEKTRRAD